VKERVVIVIGIGRMFRKVTSQSLEFTSTLIKYPQAMKKKMKPRDVSRSGPESAVPGARCHSGAHLSQMTLRVPGPDGNNNAVT